jgi:hypothetical protein
MKYRACMMKKYTLESIDKQGLTDREISAAQAT